MSAIENEKELLKKLIKKLHKNPEKNTEAVKQEFSKTVKELTPVEISLIEQELIKEGISPDSIMLMCDVHLDMFKKAIVEEEINVEPWHPIHILMEEHKDILNTLTNKRKHDKPLQALEELSEYLNDVERYFQKEENSLFPYLEKHEMEQPPKIMWKEHDSIRKLRKRLATKQNFNNETAKKMLIQVEETFSNHIYKEHKILFPAAVKLISDDEWVEIRKQFDDIGYFSFIPSML